MKIDMCEGIGIQFCGGMVPGPEIIKQLLAVLNASPEVKSATYSVVFRSIGLDRRIMVYPAEEAKVRRGIRKGKSN